MQTTLPDLDTSGITNKPEPFEDIGKFIKAVRNAEPGTLIILTNKSYKVNPKEHKIEDDDEDQDTYVLFKNVQGTPEKPIIVMAQDIGQEDEDKKVILEGRAGYKFKGCKFFTWCGFNHRHEASSDNNIFFQGGSDNRFSRCEVKLQDKGSKKKGERKSHWLQISNCKAMKVDHCFFHHKPSEGQFCNVKYRSDNKHGEGPLFEYNHFQHQDYNEIVGDDNIGDAGGEGIQMGDSALCRWYYRAIVRYNYFEECNGDGEMITNKSSGNLYYNNSFMKTLGTMTLRHGDSTAFLGNYFEVCGLRVGGRGNLIANNHFTKNSAKREQRLPLVISTGDFEQNPKEAFDDDMQGAHHERVVNNNIILNTFANGDGTADSIVYWGRKEGPKMPTGNKFKGNIITARNGKLLEIPEGVIINGKIKEDGEEKEIKNEVSDNIGWPTGNAKKGDLTSEMATTDKDPLLTEDSDGIYRLQSGSPARNKFQGMPFRELTSVDIDGEERGPNTDAGCDQFSTESKKPKKRITPEDVGPKARTDLGDSPDWDPEPVNPRE
ncbi:MAG TPA: chondroitinase-B domain-containing protein [Nitrososphaera sp.]|nr:chondroitinase-B domain-containing protein [Nitrososphaera sp.]